jgi:uncharacterized protein YecE (DUF72 family)
MTVFDRDLLKQRVQKLADEGIYLGTSSWKYPGWCGQIYDVQRYDYRGRFSQARFERNCLSEYSETFRAVCVDAAYYAFPTIKYLEGLASQVSPGFLFGFKVTDAITLKTFHNQPRYGGAAGQSNPDFLNAARFCDEFLEPCARIRDFVGILIFEFSRFHSYDFSSGREFVATLDAFFEQLPQGWPYGVEIRNREWLRPEYFECLAKHKVTHVYNSWTEMPSVEEQLMLDASQTNPNLVAARFLLKPGRTYEQAVKAFQPYEETRDPYAEGRLAGATLIRQRKFYPERKALIFVNNRLEGNALRTAEGMLDAAEV